MHSVDERFLKEARRGGNRRREMDMEEVSDLADVASLQVPLDIFGQARPPETVEESTTDWEESAMAKVVVSLDENRDPWPVAL